MKFFWRKIKESRPPEAEQFARTNQPVSRVLGSCQLVIFSNKDTPIQVIHNTRVTKQVRGLQIVSDRLDYFPKREGDKIHIEIPKEDGRFRFETIISEMYLVDPDPVGRYYITLSIPKSISLYNDRAAYRAPFLQKIDAKMFSLPEYDLERESPSQIAREDWKPLFEAPLRLEDLSVGGCGGSFDRSLKSFNIPLHQIVIQFSLTSNKVFM